MHIYRSRAPIDLACLSRCPRLHSLSLTKCHLSSFSDVGVANTHLQDIALPVCSSKQCVHSLISLSLSTVFTPSHSPLLSLSFSKSNTLDYINFSELPNLRFLDLGDNRIASIHGLEKCEKLLDLNLDENRIARIGTCTYVTRRSG